VTSGDDPIWQPFEAGTYDDLSEMQAEGLIELGVGDDAGPRETAAAVERWLEDARRDQRPVETRLSTRVALAWGVAVARQTGWAWGYYVWRGQRYPGLASPDRAHVHLPGIYILGQLEPETEITAELLFNMLAAGQRPPAQPGALSVIG
jgi:hypothetical protein